MADPEVHTNRNPETPEIPKKSKFTGPMAMFFGCVVIALAIFIPRIGSKNATVAIDEGALATAVASKIPTPIAPDLTGLPTIDYVDELLTSSYQDSVHWTSSDGQEKIEVVKRTTNVLDELKAFRAENEKLREQVGTLTEKVETSTKQSGYSATQIKNLTKKVEQLPKEMSVQVTRSGAATPLTVGLSDEAKNRIKVLESTEPVSNSWRGGSVASRFTTGTAAVAGNEGLTEGDQGEPMAWISGGKTYFSDEIMNGVPSGAEFYVMGGGFSWSETQTTALLTYDSAKNALVYNGVVTDECQVAWRSSPTGPLNWTPIKEKYRGRSATIVDTRTGFEFKALFTPIQQ
ncbi:MAG: hypothetical protein V1853_03495 [bacterium]